MQLPPAVKVRGCLFINIPIIISIYIFIRLILG